MNNPRLAHTATLLPNGKVLVAGGLGRDFNAQASAELYDSATGEWIPTTPMNHKRFFHSATLLPNGKVLIAGGAEFDSISADATAELYDPITQRWALTGPMSGPRQSHTATLLPNGMVLVAGGAPIPLPDSDSPYLTGAELYDPGSQNWTPTGSLNSGRIFHTATLLPTGKVLLVGGRTAGVIEIPELYDPLRGQWLMAESLARFSHSANPLPDGKVLVAGGAESNAYRATNTATLYDSANGTWQPTRAASLARFVHTATSLPLGRILVTGGADSSTNVISSVELYDSISGRWLTLDGLLKPRLRHTATVLPGGEVLLAGGIGNVDVESSAEPYSTATLVTSIVLGPAKKLPTGAFEFSFTNVAGAPFTALVAANASLPLSNWAVLGPVTEISPGQFRFTDPAATNHPQRFYRVRSP